MPVSRYFQGHGEKVLRRLIKQYGKEKGTRVFYALAAKRGEKPGYGRK